MDPPIIMEEELMDHTFDDIISKNYDMLKPLGDGAFSEVHLGRHLATNTKVAIKIIDKEKTKVCNIATEVALMKLCHHVHIIKLFHVMDTPLKTWLVTEYAPGGDLLDYILTKGSLKEKEAGPLFYQLALAIDYLHQRDIAHRDVKLENILIGKKGKVKLCDFGLSTVVTTQRRLLQDCGTMLYMAPEVLMGEPCNSLETDMWAVGVVLYAMLAGYRPFEHSTIPGMTELILRKSLHIPHHLSINAQDVMHCLLTINPPRRITAGQLLKHPWLHQYEQLSPPCSTEIDPRQSFPKVVEAMMLMGYTLKDIIHSVGSKMYDATMGTFNILKYQLSCGDSWPLPGTPMQPCFQISPTSPDRLRRKSEPGSPTRPEKWHREKGKGWRSYSAYPRLCWLPSTDSAGSPAPQAGALPIDTSCENLENGTGSKSSGDFPSDPSSLSAEKVKKSTDTDHNIRACCVQRTPPIKTGDLSQQMAATGLDEHIAGASATESSYDMSMVSYDMVSYDISKGLFAQSPFPGAVPDGEPPQGAHAEQDNVLRDASALSPSPGPVPDGEPPQGAPAEQDNASAQSPFPGPVPDGELPQGAPAEQDNVLRDASALSPSPGPVPHGELSQGAPAEQDNVLRDASALSPSPGPVPDGELSQRAPAEQDNVLRHASALSPSPGPVPHGEPPQGAPAEQDNASAQSPSPGPVPDESSPGSLLHEDQLAPTAIRSNRPRGWKRFKRRVVNTVQRLCCCCCVPVSRRRRESASDEQQQAQLRGS